MRRITVAVAMLVVAAAQGCGDRKRGAQGAETDTAANRAAETMRDSGTVAGMTPEAPRTYSFEQRTELVASVRARLDTLDARIKDLAGQAKSLGGAVSDRALANIRAARRAADRELGRVNSATAGNWERVRGSVTEAVDRLSEAVEAAGPK